MSCHQCSAIQTVAKVFSHHFCESCVVNLITNGISLDIIKYYPNLESNSNKEEEMQLPLVPLSGFKFGCDPELFIFNAKGKAISAAGLLPGTKTDPYVVDHGGIQVDGMAAEITIDPVDTFEDWDKKISSVLKTLQGMLPKGHTLRAVPSVVFDAKIFDEAPDIAKMLGCSSDFNAWTGDVNLPPDPSDNPFLRTAAGHIHIGWTENEDVGDVQHLMNCRDLVKQFDWYLGGWSLRMDSDPQRRLLYGKAGAMRPKPYGVEYRVLSNFWIMTKTNRLAVWNRMQQAILDMTNSFLPDRAPATHNRMLRTAIDQSTRDSSLEAGYGYPLQSINVNDYRPSRPAKRMPY